MQTYGSDGTVIGWDETGSGPSLLLVHGGIASATSWDAVRALLPEGVRVAAMDRRGRGRSGSGEDTHYSLDVEADDLLRIAEALGGSVVVAGHSIGATIALRALRRDRGLLATAVLYEPPLIHIPAEAMNAAMAAGQPEDALVAFLRDVVKVPEEDILARRGSPAWSNSVALMWTQQREHRGLGELDPDLSQYSVIQQPVRLLVGSKASSHQAEGVAALAARLPHAEVVVLEGQGHGALVQRPDLVARAIAEVLPGPL